MNYYPPRYLFRRYEIIRRVMSGQCFLEIGPGNLFLAQDLLSKFQSGILIDFNTDSVESRYYSMKKNYQQRLKLIIADFSLYDDFDSKFDCVVACEVLEHINDDLAFLKKINKLLTVHGQLILSVPARKKYWSIHDEIVGHYRRYEKQELIDVLLGSGYSKVEIASYGFPFINFTRLLRVFLAQQQYHEKIRWEKKKQSQESAFAFSGKSYLDLMGVILNKYTIFPFAAFSSTFNKTDLSEGYVVSAIKNSR